ncbi:MAG: DEAD/DEAH box helicase family protein, partial [Bacteroidales bacterium]|nr:DEAD/DEAH box helicase family protein [Bacteroidales bacterium]
MAKLKKLDSKYFNKKLVLNQWLLTQFGINTLEDQFFKKGKLRALDVLANSLRKSKPGLSSDRHHHYLADLLNHWQPTWQYTEQQFKNFDANLVSYLDHINEGRENRIEWKYFQWLSLLFIEIYLYEFFNNRFGLLSKLNSYVSQFNAFCEEQGFEAPLSLYSYEEINKLCLQNATGSGKTLLMHCNVLQFQHYAKRFAKLDDYSQVILISPNERLSEQHIIEFSVSGFNPSRLAQTKQQSLNNSESPFVDIQVTEITKLSDTQGDKVMDVASFGDQNLLLVDEGHRGLGTADSEKGWLASRRKLAGIGFTFEYSATFKEAVVAAKNDQVESDYAKSVVFDYAYRYFYEDGYGKDYRIFNLPNKQEDIIHQKPYLTASLLAFYQQLRLFQDREIEFADFNLTTPLWVLVGASVVKDDGKKETARNYSERASDIAKVLKFFGWFLSNKTEAISAIDSVLNTNAKTAGLIDEKGRDIFGSSFPYLKKELKLSPSDIFSDICQKVFQSNSGGTLIVERITGDSGELLLKVGDNPKPFGLINVGDAKGLADHLEASIQADEEAKQLDCDIQIAKSEFDSPIFAKINDTNSPVNILIGSKKFVEGWNSWRVSSMGLMNTG